MVSYTSIDTELATFADGYYQLATTQSCGMENTTKLLIILKRCSTSKQVNLRRDAVEARKRFHGFFICLQRPTQILEIVKRL